MLDEQANIEKEVDGLLVLMEKFDIDPKEKHCWTSLALNLARKYEKNWPNVKATRGAPKGSRTGKVEQNKARANTLASLLVGIKKIKKSGRPTVPKINPEDIDAIKNEYNLSGHGSDKAAIRICVEGYAKPADREQEIKYWQKRLSEQRNKIPKTSQ